MDSVRRTPGYGFHRWNSTDTTTASEPSSTLPANNRRVGSKTWMGRMGGWGHSNCTLYREAIPSEGALNSKTVYVVWKMLNWRCTTRLLTDRGILGDLVLGRLPSPKHTGGGVLQNRRGEGEVLFATCNKTCQSWKFSSSTNAPQQLLGLLKLWRQQRLLKHIMCL
jgi:hypothetical protein